MLSLDHSLSSSEVHANPSALASADEVMLRYDLFLGDIVFIIDNVDLSARWDWVPVLDFALGLEAIVDTLSSPQAVEEIFEFTESDATIAFRRDGDTVEVEASYVSRPARVSYDELRAATRQFKARVIANLTQTHPGLADNAFIKRLSAGS